MFPVPSPNSQALFNQLQSGGATPSTLDFHRAALKANAAQNQQAFNNIPTSEPTSQPPDQNSQMSMDQKSFPQQQDNFHHDDTGAASLLMLAAQGTQNGVRNQQFAVPGQPPHHLNTQMPQQMQNHMGSQSTDTSPVARRAAKNSITSVTGSAETGDFSDSAQSEQAKPTTRSRGKKGGSKSTPNNRRKADDGAVKGPANKRQKQNNSNANHTADESDEEGSPKQELNENGKKMTDEEKRKNFLERNRVAALKCRQRKKQWLANLQAKVELFSTENDHLSAQITQLREEIVNLKTLLLAHKDCPVSHRQGLGGMNMSTFLGQTEMQHANPYGMGMQNGMQMGMPMPGQGQPGIQRS